MASTPTRAYLAWIVVCLVWGTTYLAIRIALETVPPLLMAALRWTAAGGLLVAALAMRGERLPPPREWGSLAILGLLLLGFGNGAVVWAEQSVPSGLTAVLVAVVPFWMVGVERLMPGAEPLTRRRILGLMVGFGGIVLLVGPELRVQLAAPGAAGAPGLSFLGGVVATQIACVGWAIGSSYSRRRGREENVLAAAALQMLFAGIMFLVAGVGRGEAQALAFTPRTLGAVAYLTIAGSVVGFSAYAYALKHLPVATVSLYAYVNPVIAMLLGTVVLQEPLSPRIAVASAIVLAGMALVRQR
jgi:drug/metabolite transporter (DMT)-like permease